MHFVNFWNFSCWIAACTIGEDGWNRRPPPSGNSARVCRPNAAFCLWYAHEPQAPVFEPSLCIFLISFERSLNLMHLCSILTVCTFVNFISFYFLPSIPVFESSRVLLLEFNCWYIMDLVCVGSILRWCIFLNFACEFSFTFSAWVRYLAHMFSEFNGILMFALGAWVQFWLCAPSNFHSNIIFLLFHVISIFFFNFEKS